MSHVYLGFLQESVSSFQCLFNTLDEKKSELGITSYGVSVTTLEEVFLRYVHKLFFSDNYFHVSCENLMHCIFRVGENNDDTLKEKLQLSQSTKSGETLQPRKLTHSSWSYRVTAAL